MKVASAIGSPPPSTPKSEETHMREAAQGMEAMFLDYMYKQMRQTVPENEMGLDNPATKIYQSMYDSEVAEQSARLGGIGLADLIVDYWNQSRYNEERGQRSPQGSTHIGGAYEGK